MSAEQCGEVFSVGMLEEAMERAMRPRKRDPLIVSLRARKVLDHIKRTHPDWEPNVPADIWIKAYKMGLLEEE